MGNSKVISTVAELPLNINNLLCHVVKKITEINDVSKVILYGSYAKGNYNNESDIDLAIFIKDANIQEVYKQVYKICNNTKFDIQPQIFSESELLEPIGIVEEINENGIDITNLFRLNSGA